MAFYLISYDIGSHAFEAAPITVIVEAVSPVEAAHKRFNFMPGLTGFTSLDMIHSVLSQRYNVSIKEVIYKNGVISLSGEIVA